MYIYMGKRKPKLVWHKLPESIFLFLLRKYQSPLLPPFSFTLPLTDISVFDEKKYHTVSHFCFRESMKLSRKKESTISELSTHHFYVGYPIFSQLKYPLCMLWTLTSIPYLFRNNCASIGLSRATPIGGIGEIVLVSMNIPFSRRCLLSLHAALPLFFTTILQSAIIHLF